MHETAKNHSSLVLDGGKPPLEGRSTCSSFGRTFRWCLLFALCLTGCSGDERPIHYLRYVSTNADHTIYIDRLNGCILTIDHATGDISRACPEKVIKP